VGPYILLVGPLIAARYLAVQTFPEA
jgi:hypothetical protein